MNLKIRTLVLEYSLKIESHINTLLLGHLEIFDKEKTKNFGNKAGISFKSKIDLLFDINVLNKIEHQNLELQMNFRNKFLHDIESDSFTYILDKFDSGIRNRFLKFSESKKPENETEYENTFENLFLNNMKVISSKYKARRESIVNRTNYLTSLYDSQLSMSKMASNFAEEIMLIIENSELENPEINALFEPVLKRCLKFVEDYESEGNKIEELSKKFELLPKNKMII
jgi:hypothetical protein